jgi:hypothetical protein
MDWAVFNFNYHHPCESADAASHMLKGAILACYNDAVTLLNQVYGLSGIETVAHQFKTPTQGGLNG